MKPLSYILYFVLALFGTIQANATTLAEINGKVTDASTKAPLPGATIYISDLKATTLSNAAGEFTIRNIPQKGKFLVEVRYIGFKTTSMLVDLSQPKPLHFELEPSIIESAEVVITGTPFSANNKSNSLAVVSIGRDKLTQNAGTNLVDALSKVPGISQISTGGAISKPTIRGLGYNRVLTMVDGAREEAQQWGDEHGIETDQFAAARVEVLKGPASLLYGSDALGGVINIIDDFVPAEGDFNGNLSSTYSTNNGLTGTSLMLQGNQNGFVYRGRVSYKNAHGFSYGKLTVPNSGFNETNTSAMVGLNKPWGYTHLNLSRFNTNIGLVEAGPNAYGKFIDEDGNIIPKSDARTRSLDIPFQGINHYRAALNSNILLGGGQLKSTFAYQHNIRKEFEESKDEAGLHLNLQSYTYDVKYSFPVAGQWEPTVGIQGMVQQNKNNGDEYLIPDYNSHNIGFFGYLKKNFEKGAVNMGLRYDYKQTSGKDLMEDGTAVFTAFNNRFSNVSGSVGLAYELTKKLLFRANAGSGFRAPNIAELGANGRHEGTFRYEIGNPNLKQETSLQFDLGLTYTSENITLGLNAYKNRIYNYIYARAFIDQIMPFISESGITSYLPVFRFVQTDADFTGGETSVDFHLVKAIHFENTFSYVKGTNKANGSPLPFIPAASLNNELRFEPEIKGLSDPFLKIGLNHVFKQNRFDSFETETGGYSLLEAGIGTAVKVKNGKISVWLSGQNLGNKLYFNHLSRYKPVGIYNPGRNITFGINIPI